MLTENIPVFAVPENLFVDQAKLVATRDRLEAAGVEFCLSTYVDIHGVPKAKTSPLWAFEKMAHGSELFTVGAMEGMGLVGPHEDECAALPDLDTAIICPWKKNIAYLFSDLYYHGTVYPNDSRQILKRQVQRALQLGFQMNLGLEPEFYVLRTDEQLSHKVLARDRYRGICPAYDVHQTLGSMSFLEPMSNYMNELGWNLYSFDQEGGHSQFEFDFKYADALTMCDRLTFLRLMAQQVAEEIDATATFMPKPFADDFRSACHFNMSVADAETGVNLFAPESDLNLLAKKYGVATSKLAYHFTAGILRHAAAITAVTSPVYNSYQGLIAQGDMPDISWAPVIIAYGRNNRSAMLRLPLNRCCVENRAPDISCNPYLAAAMQLAAGLEGIEQELDPGQPLNRNCYELTRSELKEIGMNFLPRTLLHALEAFEADPFTERVFGAEFKGIYLKQKLKEWDEGFYPISKSHVEQRLTFI